jgi:hypothetical protein
MSILDLHMIWVTWGCPDCKQVVHQNLYDMGFGFEMDLTVGENGSCEPWIETDCPYCGQHFENKLINGEEKA